MTNIGAALALFVSAVLLIPGSDASAATDGFYWLYESASNWDGTDADRTKAPTPDYDYTYGDEAGLTFSLPWPFAFYGQSYSGINIDTNGNIWLASNGFAHSINLASTGRGPVIATWNDDLSSYYYGGVFVQHKTNPERVVIEWQTETYSEEGEYAPNSMEAVLYPNGNMRLDYNSFTGSRLKDFGSGISRGDGTSHLNLSSAFGKAHTLSGRSFGVAKVMDLSVSIDQVNSPINVSNRTFSGTMTGTEVSVTIDPMANLSAVSYPTLATWSCTASGMAEGANVITVVTKDEAGNTGSATANVIVDTLAPTTTATPAAGIFNSAQMVTLSTSESGIIYYTTDGKEPTTASARYTAPISITDSCTLKFFAMDAAGNREAVKSAAYTVTGRVTLNFTPAGTGSGTVTSTPSALACNTGCSANFNVGTQVTLLATNSEYSIFKGWNGDCSGMPPCSLIMNTNKAVGATFDKDTGHAVRLNSGSITYYPSLLSAYLAAPASATIEAFGMDFVESPVFNQKKEVNFKGGYDGQYASATGMTQIRGKMLIRQGTVRVRRVAVH